MTQPTDEQKAYELANEVFSKCFLVLLAHVQRKIRINPDYEEPTFLKAFLTTFSGVHDEEAKLSEGQIVSGVATDEERGEAYMVMFKKQGKGFLIYKVIDIGRNREVDMPEIMRLIQLSILLDNVEGDDLPWGKAVEFLGSSIPEVNFVRFPVNQWKKYRDSILEDVWRGKLKHLNPNSSEVKSLRESGTFGEVPQSLRRMMAGMYASSKYPDGKTMGVSSPDKTVQKYKVLDMAKQVLYGRPGDFIRTQGKPAVPPKQP